MLVKMTLLDGESVWINMAHLLFIVGKAQGSVVTMVGGQEIPIQESPMQFWERVSGQGQVQVPQARLIKP